MSSGCVSPNGTNNRPGWYTCRSSRSTTVISASSVEKSRRSRLAVRVPPVPPPRTTMRCFTPSANTDGRRDGRSEGPFLRQRCAAARIAGQLLDSHPADGPGDDQLLNLLGALEDVVGGPSTFGAFRPIACRKVGTVDRHTRTTVACGVGTGHRGGGPHPSGVARDVLSLMDEADVDLLPVLEKDAFVGIVTITE